MSGVVLSAPGRRVEQGYEADAAIREAVTKLKTDDDLLRWGAWCGSPEKVIRGIRPFIEQCGINHWLAWMRFSGLDHKKAMQSLELFAQQLLPAFRSCGHARLGCFV